MAEKDLKELLLSAILNKELRLALAKDPEAVIEKKGYSATPEQIAALKQLNPEDWTDITIKELDERFQGLKERELAGIPIEAEEQTK